MIEVRAIKRGFYNVIREEGEKFRVNPEHAKSTWYVPLHVEKRLAGATVDAQVEEAPKRPTTEAEARKLKKDQLQVFLKDEGIEFDEGDTKDSLIIKLFAANEEPEAEAEAEAAGEDLV